MAALLAEFIGTFALIFIGAGSIITGQSANELWSEYQESTCCVGGDTSCCN